MKMPEFNRENAEKYGVETRGGNPVRILCWDLQVSEIIAAVYDKKEKKETIYTYFLDGSILNGENDNFNLIVKGPSRWRAHYRQSYFYVIMLDGDSIISVATEYYSDIDDERYNNNDYFATIEEAEKYNRYLHECINNYNTIMKLKESIINGNETARI